MLREVVCDLEPLRLGADEDVLRRPDCGRIDKRSQRNVHVGTVPHHGEEKRATARAARVVQVVLAEDEEAVPALRELELVPLDARERLERRAGRRAALRAVAVRCVPELVRDPVSDSAALASPFERAAQRSATFTSAFPVFSPWSIAMKAAGAFSSPSVTSSR